MPYSGDCLLENIEKNSSNKKEILIETINLTKRFPSVVANDSINIEVQKGEIHCLLGENGAGKTTLAECLYGFYKPDAGSIHFKGQLVKILSPSNAIELGIGMVHQHFMLVEPHSVVENIILGTHEKGFILDIDQAKKRIKELCNQYKVEIDLDAKIWQLSVGEQQWVEILKVLYVGIELLILDEPTAVLTPQESDQLFSVLKKMRDNGLSIIFITHKLNEVMAVSDRITVLKKGKKVETVRTRDTNITELACMMVGREILFDINKEIVAPGKPVLEITDLQALNDMGQVALHGIDLSVHEGEILGIAGVAGNGQKELMEVIIGVRHAIQGVVRILGKNMLNSSTKNILDQGVGHIPSDRIKQGLIMDFSIWENLILGNEWIEPFRKGLVLNEKYIQAWALKCIEEFEISTPSINHKTKNLSGGNLQKVILAREFGNSPKILLADQPCRGLDVGVIEYVHKQLLKKRSEGMGILLISEDLDEIYTLTDRIAVIYKGKILGEFKTLEAKREKVGLLMAGVTEDNL